MSKFVGYIRVSTEDQADSRHGLNSQLDIINAFSNNSMDSVFIDEGVSGSLELSKRKNLFNAINCLDKNSVLLVAKRDRLARDVLVIATIERAVLKRGAKIISCSGEGTDRDDPASRLMTRMIDAFAEYEMYTIRERTVAALQAKKRRFERIGYIPFGFMICEDGVHIKESVEEIEIIEFMFKMRENKITFREMKEILNTKGILNRGKIWNRSTVFSIYNRNKKRRQEGNEVQL